MARGFGRAGWLAAAVTTLALAAALGSDARGSSNTTLHGNGRIAFSDVTGIASMNPDGSGQWGVELNVGDAAPAWSPDGTELAVVTHWAGNNGILVMSPDGSGARLLTTNPGDSDPAWSPDGSKLAFANGGQIFLVNGDGSGRKALTTSADGWASRPSWSSDGTRIVFSLDVASSDAGGYYKSIELYVRDLGSGAETQLTPDDDVDFAPAWAPDGSQIAFASERGGGSSIYVMNPDGSGAKALTDGSSWDSFPAWAPDGTEIAFVRDSQIWVMERDGSGAHRLTSGDGNSAPAWQPLAPAPPGCTLWGTPGNDLLVGTERNDVICGLGGDDTLSGLGGVDTLDGGDGKDSLAGGLGYDLLYGRGGNDTLDARDGGADHVSGGSGVDTALIDGRVDALAGVELPKVDRNLAVWRPATADAAEPTNPPERAVDGRFDDWWNSGGYPTHWIEIDLQRPMTIARLRLVAPEEPSGASVLALGRADTSAPYRLLHVFTGPVADLQELTYTPKRAWRAIRYLRLEVPAANAANGWVSWREIEVYAPKAKKHPRRRR